MHQLALNLDAPPAPPEVRRLTIQERFELWIDRNPSVYREFRTLAYQLRARGHEHYGAKSIVEYMRFHRALQTTDEDGWKINNVFVSRLARKLIEEDESFSAFFELRELKAD